MAKKKEGPNKSAAIRTYYDNHPDAKPADVVEAMKPEGIDVSAQFVSTIRSKQLQASGQPTKRRKVGRPKTASKASASKGTTSKGTTSAKRGRPPKQSSGETKVSIEKLVQANEMVDALGGIEQARKTLDALSQIVK
jgi:hypothetical protein